MRKTGDKRNTNNLMAAQEVVTAAEQNMPVCFQRQ